MSEDTQPSMPAPTEQERAITAALAKHGKGNVGVVDFDDGRIAIFKPPTRAVWDSFADPMRKEATNATIRQCALDCLEYPDVNAFGAILDKYPHTLSGPVLETLQLLAGKGKAVARIL